MGACLLFAICVVLDKHLPVTGLKVVGSPLTYSLPFADSSPHPTSTLNPDLEPLATLARKYRCPVFSSLTDLLLSPIGQSIDGAIVCSECDGLLHEHVDHSLMCCHGL